MKILLAPSETKKEGGRGTFELNSLLFEQINNTREEILKSYLSLIEQNNQEELSKLFGLKKASDIAKYTIDVTKEPTLKAIERYTGVAYDYIEYPNLPQKAKEYIEQNVLIFSNLFGILQASDQIPLYRLKQGAQIADKKVEKLYKQALKEPLDNYLRDEDILDIRASFYDKFYKPSKSYTTLKFLKNGKVVSHWAKAYRGIVLKHIAINQIDSIDKFIAMPIEGLSLLEIRKSKNRQEIIYQIESN